MKETILRRLPLLIITIIFICFIGCKKEEAPSMTPIIKTTNRVRGEFVTFIIHGCKITCEKIDEDYFFQSDIILTKEQLTRWEGSKGAGLSWLVSRWPNKVIYYTIEPGIYYPERIISAITHWEINTEIKFIKRTNETNYVEFISTGGDGVSYSNLGMVGGRQIIGVANNSNPGSIIHEIGHTAGLIHEHSREDRDNYIKIIWENIQTSYKYNFEKTPFTFNTATFDFSSVMLYDSYAFSISEDFSEPTITMLDGTTFSGNHGILSENDKIIVKLLYIGDEPGAFFSAYQTCIAKGGMVQFINKSINNPSSWYWEFGDGSSSTLENPNHVFQSIGKYTVSLTATNKFGSNKETKSNFIVVSDDYWTKKKDFGGGIRVGAIAFSVGNKGYVGGGFDENQFQTRKTDFWEYNPSTNIWTKKANLPVQVYGAGFSIENKGFVLNTLGDFYEYDPYLNSWKNRAPFPGGYTIGFVCFSINQKGYVGIGYHLVNGKRVGRRDFWEYDPSLDRWTRKADFIGVVRGGAIGFSAGSKGYVGIGQKITSSNLVIDQEFYKDFWEYNPETNTWIQISDFGGSGRASTVSFSIGNKGYVATGIDDVSCTGILKNDLWEYDPQRNVWIQKVNLIGEGRYSAVGFSILDKGYLGTGWGPPTIINSDFYEYIPSN